jgi:hypothetical protein
MGLGHLWAGPAWLLARKMTLYTERGPSSMRMASGLVLYYNISVYALPLVWQCCTVVGATGVRQLKDSCHTRNVHGIPSDPPRSALMISVPRYKVSRSYCTIVRTTYRTEREQQHRQIRHVFQLEALASTSFACVQHRVDDTSH